ncbi:guanine nucleotide binding protein, alpha subunit [Dichomitus squalens]|uniref:Guanine nucleotide binding protein, alpha subunit n=1 Tax=Dichomitus squalens TaxID=114155 RepID=A0A4Q9PZQ3_9APHY|nr:guanine nucleotide binding protein, alpha subunit [Dichomitus squalens]TBU60191.1 guanine nucleotide binding protein, alpha subunit [Dichomitus squalens]
MFSLADVSGFNPRSSSRSEEIDAALSLERRQRRRVRAVQLLLLGPPESGKSTVRKQLQLLYDLAGFNAERHSWLTAIYLNIIESVRHILQTLEEDTVVEHAMLGATSGAVYSQLASPRNHTAERSGGRAALLRERLTPLLDVEQRLTHHLSEIVHDRSMNSDHLSVGTEWQARTEQLKPSSSALRCDRDDLGDHSRSMVSADTLVDSEFDSPTAHDKAEKEELLSKVSSILRASAEYISELVGLPDVEVLRANRRLRIAEWAEYFLPEIERVSQRDYIPSDDDVLHARTQTKGIVEQVFRVSASNVTKYMNVVDIAGVGGMKQVWISRCENTDAVIFVAPIGAFDETLDDDSKTNRLAYSTQLFKQLFSNRLLNMATWVLFMNQVDVLQRKIAAGVRLNTWLEDFGDRPNDLDTAMGYFKDRFHMIKDDIVPWRAHFTHFTSAVDTKSMHPVLQTVPKSILRRHLHECNCDI